VELDSDWLELLDPEDREVLVVGDRVICLTNRGKEKEGEGEKRRRGGRRRGEKRREGEEGDGGSCPRSQYICNYSSCSCTKASLASTES
jgi:hypothetical protein